MFHTNLACIQPLGQRGLTSFSMKALRYSSTEGEGPLGRWERPNYKSSNSPRPLNSLSLSLSLSLSSPILSPSLHLSLSSPPLSLLPLSPFFLTFFYSCNFFDKALLTVHSDVSLLEGFVDL